MSHRLQLLARIQRLQGRAKQQAEDSAAFTDILAAARARVRAGLTEVEAQRLDVEEERFRAFCQTLPPAPLLNADGFDYAGALSLARTQRQQFIEAERNGVNR